ncbi:MAG: hypothetical protein Q8M92_04915 [Candidatus Subteraquimicrobiales bacterium]|nr:hypothetical protein [Candidatus Subteraquimicrobiales bacterium]
MQIESFDWFVNREKGKPCLVAGNAPTIINFPYSKFNGIYIAMGDGPLRLKKKFTANYWVNANDEFPIPEEHLKIINKFKDTLFIFSDSVVYSRKRNVNPDFLNKSLKVNWFSYDQRHFNAMPCKNKKLKCCELLNIYPGRLTIQEFIQRRYKTESHYSTASTVAIHALAFAIIMGCNPIYLQGIEIPVLKTDYTYSKVIVWDFTLRAKNYLNNWHKLFNPPAVCRFVFRFIKYPIVKLGLFKEKSAFYNDLSQILDDFTYLIDLAHKNGISVINLSNTSSLNNIRGLKYMNPSEIV